jgi:GxxExxY protein
MGTDDTDQNQKRIADQEQRRIADQEQRRTADQEQKRIADQEQKRIADQERRRGKHVELTERVIGVFYDVYNELGSGFLESVYREAMRLALTQAGLTVKTEVPVPVSFRGVVVGMFRADLIVNDCLLVELKAVDQIVRQHESQTMHYLRATSIEVALLMNFGPSPRFKRLVMDNELKKLRQKSVESVTIDVEPFSAPEMTS